MTTTLRPLGPVERGSSADNRGQRFAVCHHGRPIGSVQLSQQGGQGWVSELEVAADRRRRGHGSIAVLAGEEVLRWWGCRQASMSVPAEAAACQALGEALGYVLDRQTMVKRLGWTRPRLPAGAEIRRLRPEEYPGWLAAEIVDCEAELVELEQVTPAAARECAPELYAALLPQQLDTPGMAVRVLDDAGITVGSVLIGFTARGAPRRGWVYYVRVDPGRRGRGHGRTLMLAAERECRAHGLRELGLNVYAGNQVAAGLYASLGYRVETRVLTKPL